MNFLVKLMCFAMLWECIACRPNNNMEIVDYRWDMGGMTMPELCAQYPNGATFPNLLLTCMKRRNFSDDNALDGLSNTIKKLMDALGSVKKTPIIE